MLGDLVSFSDAHEEKEIPIIAANIQRLVPPEKSQIWAGTAEGGLHKTSGIFYDQYLFRR